MKRKGVKAPLPKLQLPALASLQHTGSRTASRTLLTTMEKWCRKAATQLQHGRATNAAQILKGITDAIIVYADVLISHLTEEFCADVADSWDRCLQVCWMDVPLTVLEQKVVARWVDGWQRLPGWATLQHHARDIFPLDIEDWLNKDEDLRYRDWDDEVEFKDQRRDIEAWLEKDHSTQPPSPPLTNGDPGSFDEKGTDAETSDAHLVLLRAIKAAILDIPISSGKRFYSVSANPVGSCDSHSDFIRTCEAIPGAVPAYLNDDVGIKRMGCSFYAPMDILDLSPEGAPAFPHQIELIEVQYHDRSDLKLFLWTASEDVP
ncbi:hypothetical protein DFJ77DRAFT_512337 [Powellomyces hirtus]|nr:hypothetical protein DFJ77DRAFT_512337 [Powellomyces hirtus]